jgi:hypothetical protein
VAVAIGWRIFFFANYWENTKYLTGATRQYAEEK